MCGMPNMTALRTAFAAQNRQLLEHGKPVLVFDWKRNYRDLLTLPGFQDVEIYTVGRDVAPFYYNPLIPY